MNGLVISCSVATTLAAQRIVSALTGTGKAVKYPASLRELPFGVTVDSVKDVTQAIPVQIDGVAYVTFGDSVGAGELVSSDTSGQGKLFALALTSTAISLPAAYAGILFDEKVNVTGTAAHLLIRPGFDRAST